jgi:hypothetical protein
MLFTSLLFYFEGIGLNFHFLPQALLRIGYKYVAQESNGMMLDIYFF